MRCHLGQKMDSRCLVLYANQITHMPPTNEDIAKIHIRKPKSWSWDSQEYKNLALKRLLKFKRVNLKTECWEFSGARDGCNYGDIRYASKMIKAHRLAWLLFVGPIPDDKEVCHSCDNRPCFNPAHLFLGTHTENMSDAKNKGRLYTGPSHSRKLSVDDVRSILEYRSKGLTTLEISMLFPVCNTTIHDIVTGKKYKEVMRQ